MNVRLHLPGLHTNKLDVSSGAICTALYSSRLYNISHPPAWWALLFFGVMGIYWFDDFYDIRKSFSKPHYKRYKALGIAVVSLIISLVCLLFLPKSYQQFIAFSFLAMLVYYIYRHTYAWFRQEIKELLIAFIYVFVVVGINLYVLPAITLKQFLFTALFFMMILFNVILFSLLHEKDDIKTNDPNALKNSPKLKCVTPYIISALSVLLLTAINMFTNETIINTIPFYVILIIYNVLWVKIRKSNSLSTNKTALLIDIPISLFGIAYVL